ncbi:restriction endonuclease subunit S [Vibrio parahaemolyticus]|uniref:restriction endonuclease subunit S n=1 Tax=Vibrio parahaemolyticus TaxID=670 RepID=UPI00215C6F46|nr:restriction endonuclease subunit S [Vibrio parahaemolyticus]MCR9712335.1 restriction endonuclease subunit S [Vibrio parahaemolyticus]
MRSHYKRIGDYVTQIKLKNTDGSISSLKGININKHFMPSVANINGTDLSKYRVVTKNQFAFNPMHVGRDEVLPISMLEDDEPIIVSPAYVVFEVKDEEELLPAYLMMWCRRSEFDRNAWFMTDNSVRGGFSWADFCDMELPIPSIEKQREIVREYNVVNDRISLNEQLINKLEDTAKNIYKQWFVDFSIPDESVTLTETKNIDFPQIPKGWDLKRIDELASKVGSGSTPRGGKGAYKPQGISLIRSMNVHDYQFVYEDLAFIDDAQAKKLANVEIKSRDVLINITGVSVARCCVVPDSVLPARVNQHVMIVRPTLKMSYYLQCALASSNYKSRLLGTSEGASTRQALTKADIEEFLVLVPSETVLSRFETIAEALFSKMEVLAQTSQKLKELRSIVLSRLATV